MGSSKRVTTDRTAEAVQLQLSGGTTSQWLNGANFRSCFCIALQSTGAVWSIEVQLPNGQVAPITTYALGESLLPSLFAVGSNKFVSMSAMCGLPFRFVSSLQQTNHNLWVVLKS
jgi:hypothetical protein